MNELWNNAHFAEAARAYDAEPARSRSLEATLLRARIYLKHDDAPAAIALLKSAVSGRGVAAIRRTMLLGASYAHAPNYPLADELLSDAENAALRANDPELICDVAFYRAQRYAYERKPDAARRFLPAARASKSEHAQLRALQLEAFILDLEGRHRDEERVLLELLSRVDPNRVEHVEIRAWATDTLAYLGRELWLPEALPEVQRQLEGIAWSHDLDERRFQALKALGWACALRGDYFNAFRHLRHASKYATSSAWLTVAAAERAQLARCTGEHLWSRQELAEAEEYAGNVDWDAVRDDARMGLLQLAELFVAIDPAKASYYQARFCEKEGIKAPYFHLKGDARLSALAQYSEAVVDLASGHRKIAVSLLKKALETFQEHGYDWRAGRCALRLNETTHARTYLIVARECLRNYMNSWLGDEYRALLSPQTVILPPMQQRVLDELRRGSTVSQIAKKFGRSEHTIRNHIKPIFKAYGVNSRSALMARVAER